MTPQRKRQEEHEEDENKYGDTCLETLECRADTLLGDSKSTWKEIKRHARNTTETVKETGGETDQEALKQPEKRHGRDSLFSLHPCCIADRLWEPEGKSNLSAVVGIRPGEETHLPLL